MKTMHLRLAVMFALIAVTMTLVLAFVVAAQASPLTTTYIVSGTNDPTPSACTPIVGGGYSCPSLRSAIIAANANPGSTIRLTHGATYNLTIAASGNDNASTGDLNITADTTFNFGNVICMSDCAATIQGGAGWHDRILNINSGAHVDAFLLTIRNGNVTGADGGGILNRGTLSLSNSTIVSNTTNLWGGGGIQNYGVLMLTDTLILSNTANYGGGLATGSPSFYTTTATLNNCQIIGNQSINQGGGIYNFGTITINGGTISHNSAKQSGSWGGGLAHDDGNLIMTGTLVVSNTATIGGGISVDGAAQITGITVISNTATYGGGFDIFADVQMTGVTVTQNIATQGGGIRSQRNLTITNSTVQDNQAQNGGGILTNGDLIMMASTVQGNSSQGNGGGIMASGNLTLINSLVTANHTYDFGGGLRLTSAGNAQIMNSQILNNHAGAGGGIDNEGTLNMDTSMLEDNVSHAPWIGGAGLWNTGSGVALLSASTISGNISTGPAGGILNDMSGALQVMDSTVQGNYAETDGGGIFNAGALTVQNSTLSGNQADRSGGAIANAITSTQAATLNNVTIAYNQSDANNDGIGKGGGLAAISGTLLIRNTLIGQNNDVSSQAPDCSGITTSDRYNLIQNTTGCTLSGNLVGNLTGQNPLIGPLQNNGGSTWTHALLQGSPAINAGNPTAPGSGSAACFTTDQRGLPRPAGGRCDIGAYESGAAIKVYLPLIRR